MRYATLILLISTIAATAEDQIFVVQQLDESLGSIGLTSGNVNAHATTLGNLPNDVVEHGGMLYVTNSGYNNVQEIDAATATTVREIQVPGASNVWSLAHLNDDSIAVTGYLSGNVVVVRLSDEEIVADIPVGPAPEGIVTHGEYCYVCVTGVQWPNFGPSYVRVLDRRSLETLDSFAVSANAQSAAVDDLHRLHVVCTGNYSDVTGKVHVIDLRTGHTESILNVGGTPTAISIEGDYACLAAGGWGGEGHVHRYRMSDLTVEHDSGNPLRTGVGAYDVVARADGSFYVSCFERDVVEQRSREGDLVRSFPVSDGPGHMVWVRGPSAAPGRPRRSADSPVLIEAYPNPFNGAVRLVLNRRFEMDRRINIYNVLGGRVASVVVPAGAQGATWNVGLSSGISISTGTYVLVLDRGFHALAKRLVYVK